MGFEKAENSNTLAYSEGTLESGEVGCALPQLRRAVARLLMHARNEYGDFEFDQVRASSQWSGPAPAPARVFMDFLELLFDPSLLKFLMNLFQGDLLLTFFEAWLLSIWLLLLVGVE